MDPTSSPRPRPSRRASTAPVLLAFGALSTLAGCRSTSESFPAKPVDQVWTAMVKAAEQPEYNDWHVIENDVWADEKSGRIEIWRVLRRYKDPPGQWSRLEDQEWTFAILMTPPEAPDQPVEASFDVRSWCVPSHSWMEGERYFDQVWRFLGGRPTEVSPSQPPSQPASKPDATPESKPTESEEQSAPAAEETPANPPPVDLPD